MPAPNSLSRTPVGASPTINRHTNDCADAGAPKHSAAPLPPAGGGTGQGAADDIVEILEATEEGRLQHGSFLVPAPGRGATVARESAAAATEGAAVADKRLELLANQMGRIALAVGAEE
jgi:hypothetical protein